jgi:hypothetical protein
LQLRMRMHVVAPGGDLAVQRGDAIDDRHGVVPRSAAFPPARANLAKAAQKGARDW